MGISHSAKTWMLLIGLWFIVHPGFVMVRQRKGGATGDEADAEFEINPLSLLEVCIGTLMALWASIGDFKPIRVADAPKPKWETAFARNDFRSFYSTRTRHLYKVIEKRIPQAPAI